MRKLALSKICFVLLSYEKFIAMEKGRRNRRSTKELDDLLLDIVKELIEDVGFSNITISSVVQKAKIEPVSFYNRFSDITELFDKYVRTYDYWMNDLSDFSAVKHTPKQNSVNMLVGLINTLNKDVSMQRILAWEITDDNYITRRTARIRETHSESLTEYFVRTYSDDVLDIRVVVALLISGIYYLCLHKKMSTFCGVDFDTKEGIELLKKNVIELVNRVYLKSASDYRNSGVKMTNVKKAVRVAYEKGIDVDTIKEIFDLPVEEINIILGFGNAEVSQNEEVPVKRKRGRPKKVVNSNL